MTTQEVFHEALVSGLLSEAHIYELIESHAVEVGDEHEAAVSRLVASQLRALAARLALPRAAAA